jgi:hypothetical protein
LAVQSERQRVMRICHRNFHRSRSASLECNQVYVHCIGASPSEA